MSASDWRTGSSAALPVEGDGRGADVGHPGQVGGRAGSRDGRHAAVTSEGDAATARGSEGDGMTAGGSIHHGQLEGGADANAIAEGGDNLRSSGSGQRTTRRGGHGDHAAHGLSTGESGGLVAGSGQRPDGTGDAQVGRVKMELAHRSTSDVVGASAGDAGHAKVHLVEDLGPVPSSRQISSSRIDAATPAGAQRVEAHIPLNFEDVLATTGQDVAVLLGPNRGLEGLTDRALLEDVDAIFVGASAAGARCIVGDDNRLASKGRHHATRAEGTGEVATDRIAGSDAAGSDGGSGDARKLLGVDVVDHLAHPQVSVEIRVNDDATEGVGIFTKHRISQHEMTRRQIALTRAAGINAHRLKCSAAVAGAQGTENTGQDGQEVSLLGVEHVVGHPAGNSLHRVVLGTHCQLGQFAGTPDVGAVHDDANLLGTAQLVDRQRHAFSRHLNGALKVGRPVGDFELVTLGDVLGNDRIVAGQASSQELRPQRGLLVDVIAERIVDFRIRPVKEAHAPKGSG